jgi:hypothetical protein
MVYTKYDLSYLTEILFHGVSGKVGLALKQSARHEDLRNSGCVASCIINSDIEWMCVVGGIMRTEPPLPIECGAGWAPEPLWP